MSTTLKFDTSTPPQYIRPETHHNHNDGHQAHQKIHLSPWDLKSLIRPYMQQVGLLFANPNQSKQEAEKIVTQLKTSLSITLLPSYNTVSFYIECKPAGAEFVHASADITIYIQHSFFTLSDIVNYDGRTQPLLSVQVTELIDGFFLSCSMNHTVCDGRSLGSSPTDNHISRLHVFDRSCLMNKIEKDLPIRFPLSNVESWAGYKYTPPQLDERVFIFTHKNIAKLREKEDHKNVIISSLQAVLAHVWVAVTRARCRLDPPLPEMFVGNSAMHGAATAKVHEILEAGGFELGALVTVRSVNDATIPSYGKSWMEKPVVNKMEYYLSNNHPLLSGGSPRFNMLGNDFGWGDPIAVRSGNRCDEKMTSTPGSVSGSIGIEACLSAKTLEALENDAEFMGYATI
ncbi:hypothetical protein MKW92_046149 [Papaver armeniacum]|nr:hypothetical protein MKW92_046149 [Papaver armeniacum]